MRIFEKYLMLTKKYLFYTALSHPSAKKRFSFAQNNIFKNKFWHYCLIIYFGIFLWLCVLENHQLTTYTYMDKYKMLQSQCHGFLAIFTDTNSVSGSNIFAGRKWNLLLSICLKNKSKKTYIPCLYTEATQHKAKVIKWNPFQC